jgi:chaperonin GroEL
MNSFPPSFGLGAQGMKIISAGTNPVQLTRGIEKTVNFLVTKLAELSTEVSDGDLVNVAAVSAGGNMEVGQLIADAMAKVGRQGVVSMEESRTAQDNLYVVEGMQFERGYISPYFVTDPERMVRRRSSFACSAPRSARGHSG